MEILQFLLCFLLEEYAGKDFAPLIETMKENDFDIKKALKNIPMEKLAPIIKNFMGKLKERTENDSVHSLRLTPINNIANERIINCLTEYFENLS